MALTHLHLEEFAVARASVVNFDGSCEPVNPGGTASYGWVALDRLGNELTGGRGTIGHGEGMSNNVAEFHALLNALRWVASHAVPPRRITIRGDSKLVIEIMNGRWRCKAPYLQAIRDLCREQERIISDRGTEITYQWLPREENERADELAQVPGDRRRRRFGRVVVPAAGW
jgi:ribonuclease HI